MDEYVPRIPFWLVLADNAFFLPAGHWACVKADGHGYVRGYILGMS